MKKNTCTHILIVFLVFPIVFWAGFSGAEEENVQWEETTIVDRANPDATPDNDSEKTRERGFAREDQKARLFFIHPDYSFLGEEERSIPYSRNNVLLAKHLLDALIKGPDTRLVPAIPKGTEVRSVHIQNQIVYADFSEKLRTGHPKGIRAELFTVYSIVNTLSANMERISGVRILIRGGDAPTLAGHIDLMFPVQPNMRLVR